MKTKRILSFLLSVIISFSTLMSLPMDAFANEVTSGVDVMVNPLYEEYCDDDYVKAKTTYSSVRSLRTSYSSDVVYENPVQAAEALRDKMVDKQQNVSLKFYCPTGFFDDDIFKLIRMAYSEELSVSPVDGDYLKFTYKNCTLCHTTKKIGSRLYCEFDFEINYSITKQQEQVLTEKINEDIASLNLDGKSDYLKIKTIHDYMCESIRYDYLEYSGKYRYHPYGGLILGYCVCQGYAVLFTRLCKEIGLVSRVITGVSEGKGGHAWNIVKIGDLFYFVDVTWDDCFDNPDDPDGDIWTDRYYHYWMLKGTLDFERHIPTGEYATEEFWIPYPMSDYAYVCKHDDYEELVSVVPPTCTEQGYSSYYCSLCDEIYNKDYVDANGHTEVIDQAVEPTCTSSGLTEGKHCSVCNAVLTRQNYVSRLGHDYNTVTTPPTCSSYGYTKYTCNRCGYNYTDNYVDVIDHDYNTVTTLPTCSNYGYTTYTCNRCGYDYTDDYVDPTEEHNYVSNVLYEPTCYYTGTMIYECECGDCYYVDIPMIPHTIEIWQAEEPTCDSPGYTEGQYCSECYATIVEQEVIPALGHNYESVITPPTCAYEGYTTYTCTRCDYEYYDNYIPATGKHNYVSNVLYEPTCYYTGTMIYECECGDCYYVDIPMIPHTIAILQAEEPTCDYPGYTEGQYCSECYATIVEQEIIPALGHNYESVITPPTCSNYGYTTYTCTRCDYEYYDNYIPATEKHNYVSNVLYEPTCDFKGTIEYECECGDCYYEDIPMIPHTIAILQAEEPTCYYPGYTEGQYCSECYATIVEQKEIPKTAHSYKTTTTKATLNSNGSSITSCTVCGTTNPSSIIYYIKTVSLSATSYTYNGKVKTPSVTVKDSNGKTLKKGTDYDVSYAKGRKNVGKYAVTVKFKGKYSGSKTLYFTINPKATSISKLTASKKSFKVYWKKQSSQTTGYQIQYSTSSKFKNAKTVTVSKNSTTSKTISKLSAKKKYYVRIRTYKTVGKKNYYSSWSSEKAVKTK